MCGIAGVLALREGQDPPGLPQLRAMCGALRHRGPDEFGIYRDARVGLGHTRLSIIDLSTGQQPLSNEDGTLWVVFNGEIFNHVELRAELEGLGHRFRTRSDTEVIVHAYESWGDDAFDRFNGQWALALWDAPGGRLTLSRDRLGVRPLHLMEHGGRLYFGSEVKAIFAADPALPRALDPLGLDETFTFWSTVPPRTVWAGVSELPPGHARTYDVARGQVRDRRYWHPGFPVDEAGQFAGSLEEAVERTRAALDEATRLRLLRADVPVGSYLSGGLDSSLVAALAARHTGDRLQTFSLRFADAEYDETRFQDEMVARLGTEHHAITIARQDIARCFPDVIRHTERPILRTAPAPLFLLSKLVRDLGIKVVLTGEGADEMFAGYDLFREAKVRRFWARRPESRLRPRLLERLYPYLARSPVSQQAMARQFFGRNLAGWREPGFSHDTRWHTTAAVKRLFSRELSARIASEPEDQGSVRRLLATLPDEFRGWSFLAQDQYLELRTLLAGYLLSSQGDRMLMAHSVEGRFPFLDPNVVALAASLPPAYKLRVLDEKHVLKAAARGLVPDAIARRQKQPYRAPDALAFVGEGAPDWPGDVLSEAAVREAGVFDPRAIALLWNKCRSRAGDVQLSNGDNMALVGALSTQLVHLQMVKGAPAAAPDELRPLTLVDRLTPRVS